MFVDAVDAQLHHYFFHDLTQVGVVRLLRLRVLTGPKLASQELNLPLEKYVLLLEGRVLTFLSFQSPAVALQFLDAVFHVVEFCLQHAVFPFESLHLWNLSDWFG